MADVNIKQLLEAGVHFGHQTQRWNPKMKKFIFGERNGIYIINLEITLECLQKAVAFLKQVAAQGKEILFVGTKKQAQAHIKEAANNCGMPFVDQRWLGGMLTNFETIRKSIARLDQIDKLETEGSFQFMKKKEVLMLTREREKLTKNITGIRKMRKAPGALFVIDSKKEEIAIHEARKLGIPVVAVIDTNSDPDKIDYPIPGNDDAIRAIKLFCAMVQQNVMEGANEYRKVAPQVAPTEETVSEAAAVAVADVDLSAVHAETAAVSVPELPEDSKEEKLAEMFVPEVVDEEDKATKAKKVIRKVK